MFAMLSGSWPRVTGDGARIADLEADLAAGRATASDLAVAVERLVADAVAAQLQAGMGLVTDGGVRWADPPHELLDAVRTGDTGADGMLVRAWRAAAALVDVPVAAVMTGPWTLAVAEAGGLDELAAVPGLAVDLADLLGGELEALAAAGCPVIQVVEPGAVDVGEDERARAGFARAHRRLLRRAGGLHAMLAVVGGSAAAAGAGAIFAAPYRSHLFDLIDGPDNWHLVRAAPPERGIVCAALVAGDGAEDRDQSPQLVWAARYAASVGARGMERVGLANASPLGGLEPAEARRALGALGRAASLAAMPVAEAVEAGLDPRTILTSPGATRAQRGTRRRSSGRA